MENKNIKPEQFICNFIYNFVDKNFEHITYDLSDSKFSTEKYKFLEEIKDNFEYCSWVLTELMNWGMISDYEEIYLKEHIIIDQEDYFVYNLFGTILNLRYNYTEHNWICNFGYPEYPSEKKLLIILQQVYKAGVNKDFIDFNEIINNFKN